MVDDELPPVRAVNRGDLGAQLALEPVHPRLHLPQLVLEPEHLLDAGEVEPELGREPLDEPEAVEVAVGVEPRAARRARGPDEPLRLVQPQRLRVHADEVGGDGDHVAAAVGHQRASAKRSRGFSRETLL